MVKPHNPIFNAMSLSHAEVAQRSKDDPSQKDSMNARDARALIAAAIPRPGGTWADFGAGDGTFTRALVDLLGPNSRIYAVDRDESAVASLAQWATRHAPNVTAVLADVTNPLEIPGLDALDGMLLANVLHFIRDADGVLTRLANRLRPGGRVVIVEYDRRRASRWVPYPIPPGRLVELARSAGLTMPHITATRPSMFGGTLYAAAADRLSSTK
jgi:precorrin-6B methylase 2